MEVRSVAGGKMREQVADRRENAVAFSENAFQNLEIRMVGDD